MDGYPFPAVSSTGNSTAQPPLHHSTNAQDVRSSLRSLAQASWEQHLVDVHQSHRWLEGFFDYLNQQGHFKSKGRRPAMSELIKTPGRKRLASTTHNGNTLPSAAGKKDPVATLLFPSAPIFPALSGKENGSLTSENGPQQQQQQSPNRLSPSRIPFASSNAPRSPVRSPLRGASPRPQQSASQQQRNVFGGPAVLVSQTHEQQPTRITQQAVTVFEVEAEEMDEEEEEVIVVQEEEELLTAADLSNVMEEDEEAAEEENDMDAEPTPTLPDASRFSNASTVQEMEEHADLSIIGEEAEEEDASVSMSLPPPVPALAADPTTTSTFVGPSSSLVLAETQFSSPRLAASSPLDAPTHLAPAAPGSPRSRVVSGASSIAEEADADEVAVPLNDAPSLLRTLSSSTSGNTSTTGLGLGSSTPASSATTTRTPGGSSVSRFTSGVGGTSYSAAKLSASLSSPPAPSTAQSGAMRASTGGQPRTLNFVGLPKKSLGLGLGLGRSWGGSNANEGGASSSQGHSQSQSQSQSSSQGVSLPQQASTAVVQPATAAATGNAKRKSVEPADLEEAASKARRDALASRMKSMQARQSALPGTGARISGINGAVGLGVSTNKPLSASSSVSVVQQAVAATVVAPTPAAPTPMDATLTTASSNIFKPVPPPPTAPLAPTSSTAAPALTRRPSVMDRVKSFEKSSASDVRPPSPSKIPAAISHSLSHASRPISPPPKSPKRNILSPHQQQQQQQQQQSKIASPPPRGQQIASPRMQLRSSPAPVVQPKSPARPISPIGLQQQRLQQTLTLASSTTPKASPPPSKAGIMQRLQVDSDHEEEEEVQSESEEESIRVVTQLQTRPLSPVAVALEVAEEEAEVDAHGKRLVSLPAEPDAGSDADAEDGEDDDREEGEVVVEKGRGALASALEKEIPSEKVVMPGAFGEEGDSEVEILSKPMNALVKPMLHKKGSQSSLASSHSSQSQGGGGMLSSIFGSKNGAALKKTTADGKVKSIQLAAAAAKKEQVEKERRAAIKEEREQKRLENLQRRQEEEKQKVEEERKLRAEGAERKRKEREEQQIKSSKIVRPKAKIDEEPAKKRKVDSSAEQKTRPEIKKPQHMRPASSTNYQSSSLISSQNRNPLATSQGRPLNAGPSSSTTTTPAHGLNKSASSMIGVKFMAPPAGGSAAPPGRVAGNGQANKPFGTSSQNARPPPPAPAPAPRSEPEIELPDIDSEYSDSGDEGHDEKIKALPGWAQSPALAAALYRQQHVNPDDIFGPIPPLSMQEIFRTNSTRITKRTSSACWEGTDALTADDMARYNLAMGYTRASTSKQ